jgi:hypothetical protein
MKLITVCTAFNPAEAPLVRSRLMAADLPSFVANENASAWLAGTAAAQELIDAPVP